MVTPAAPRGGRVLARRYHLLRVLGRGAMGAVWEAEDTFLRRTVAVKEVVLPGSLSPEERAVSCERTLREARAIARLGHPNVVTLFDVLDEDARPWVVMELVPSRSLAEVIKEDGPLHPLRVATVGLAVLGALEAAHAAGITHRDVKPGNILLGHDGRVKLTDFGIARAAGDDTITGTGLLVGSPSYIAPEIIKGQEAGPPADLWGLGATLYAAAEGRAPFSGGDAMETLAKVVQEPPTPYEKSRSLVPALAAMLEKDPNRRARPVDARRLLLDVLRGGDEPARPEAAAPAPAPPPAPPPSGPGLAELLVPVWRQDRGTNVSGAPGATAAGAGAAFASGRPGAPAPGGASAGSRSAPAAAGHDREPDDADPDSGPVELDDAILGGIGFEPESSDGDEAAPEPGAATGQAGGRPGDEPEPSGQDTAPADAGRADRWFSGRGTAGGAEHAGDEAAPASGDVAAGADDLPEGAGAADRGGAGAREPHGANEHGEPAASWVGAGDARRDAAEAGRAAAAGSWTGAREPQAEHGATAGGASRAEARGPRAAEAGGASRAEARGPHPAEAGRASRAEAAGPHAAEAGIGEVRGAAPGEAGAPGRDPAGTAVLGPVTAAGAAGATPRPGAAGGGAHAIGAIGDEPARAAPSGRGAAPAGGAAAPPAAGSGRSTPPAGDPEAGPTVALPSWLPDRPPGATTLLGAYGASSPPDDATQRIAPLPFGGPPPAPPRRAFEPVPGPQHHDPVLPGGLLAERAPADRRRRTVAALLAAVGLLLIAVIGGALLLNGLGRDDSGSESRGGDPSAPTGAPAALPAGYIEYRGDGFTVGVPAAWKAAAARNGVVDVTEPGSDRRFLRLITVNGSTAALQQLTAAEQQFAANPAYAPYQKVRLEKVAYRGYDAADWEFTFGDRQRHVLYRGIVVNGQTYGIYLSVPAERWEESRAAFRVAADSFRLTAGG